MRVLSTILLTQYLTVLYQTLLVKITIEVKKIKDQFSGIEYEKEKIGVPIGVNCINPITNEYIAVYISNFVLDNYGEGAIFGCSAHDERDFEFA